MGLWRVAVGLPGLPVEELVRPVKRTPHPGKKTTKNRPFLTVFQIYSNFTLCFLTKQVKFPQTF
ncbi:hypothetical protein, partial [Enterobacter intestinihominis]